MSEYSDDSYTSRSSFSGGGYSVPSLSPDPKQHRLRLFGQMLKRAGFHPSHARYYEEGRAQKYYKSMKTRLPRTVAVVPDPEHFELDPRDEVAAAIQQSLGEPARGYPCVLGNDVIPKNKTLEVPGDFVATKEERRALRYVELKKRLSDRYIRRKNRTRRAMYRDSKAVLKRVHDRPMQVLNQGNDGGSQAGSVATGQQGGGGDLPGVVGGSGGGGGGGGGGSGGGGSGAAGGTAATPSKGKGATGKNADAKGTPSKDNAEEPADGEEKIEDLQLKAKLERERREKEKKMEEREKLAELKARRAQRAEDKIMKEKMEVLSKMEFAQELEAYRIKKNMDLLVMGGTTGQLNQGKSTPAATQRTGATATNRTGPGAESEDGDDDSEASGGETERTGTTDSSDWETYYSYGSIPTHFSRVSSLDETDTAVDDLDDEYFASYHGLELIAPSPNIICKHGSLQLIKWRAGPETKHVNLKIYIRSSLVLTLAQGIPNKSMLYWIVPKWLPPCTWYRIKIESVEKKYIFRFSKPYFAVVECSDPNVMTPLQTNIAAAMANLNLCYGWDKQYNVPSFGSEPDPPLYNVDDYDAVPPTQPIQGRLSAVSFSDHAGKLVDEVGILLGAKGGTGIRRRSIPGESKDTEGQSYFDDEHAIMGKRKYWETPKGAALAVSMPLLFISAQGSMLPAGSILRRVLSKTEYVEFGLKTREEKEEILKTRLKHRGLTIPGPRGSVRRALHALLELPREVIHVHGQGAMVFADGGFYRGGFFASFRHGEGETEYMPGMTYKGGWDGDFFHGEILVFPGQSGARYVGGLKGGVPHGEGEFVSSGGTKYNGAWENGLLKGRGRLTLRTGISQYRKWHGVSFRDGVRLLLRERDDNDRKEQERMNKLLGRHLKKKLEERTAELQDRLERERIRMEFERREEIKRIREEFLDRKFKNQQRDDAAAAIQLQEDIKRLEKKLVAKKKKKPKKSKDKSQSKEGETEETEAEEDTGGGMWGHR